MPARIRAISVCRRLVLSSAVAASSGVVVAAGAAPTEPEDAAQIAELDLQTLLNTPVEVWTPSKAPQKSHEAPAIITTVTREQIAVWGYRSIAELLNHLLGFYVVDDHTTPNVAVRGSSGGLYSDSSIIKVLINGHPVSFLSTGGHWLGPELVPLSAVERVEVIRGPASALYGADAFLGLINIQTRSEENVSGATAWLGIGRVGEHPATDIDVSLGTRRGMVEALVAFRRNDQDLSGLTLPASSPAPRIPRYNQGDRIADGLEQGSTAALATVTLRPRAGRSLSAFAHHSAIERGSEFGSFYQLAHGYNERDALSFNRVSLWHARAGIALREQLSQRLGLSLRAAYFQGGTRGDNRVEVGSEYYYVRRRLGFRGGDLDGHLEWSLYEALTLAAGVSLLLDDERLPSRIAVAKQTIANVVERGGILFSSSTLQPRKKFFNIGTYLQSTWQAYEGRLGITGGLRYDRHNIYGGQLSRRLGIVASPLATLHLKLLHGSAFQAPSPFLLYAAPLATGDVVGNARLHPQYVNTYELQVTYQPSPSFDLSSAVVYNLVDDKTEFLQQGLNQIARNVLRTATLSWESRAELRFRDWLNAHVSLELQRTRLRSGQRGYVGLTIGEEGGIYPRMMIHSGVVAQIPVVPARIAVMGSYIGARRASGTNILLNSGPYTLPDYVIVDANLTTEGFRILRHPAQEISFSVSGKNLLGAQGPAPGSSGVDFPLAPRAMFFQVNLGM